MTEVRASIAGARWWWTAVMPRGWGAALAVGETLVLAAACEHSPGVELPSREDDRPVAAAVSARGAYSLDGGILLVPEVPAAREEPSQPSLPRGGGVPPGAGAPGIAEPALPDTGTAPSPAEASGEEPVAL